MTSINALSEETNYNYKFFGNCCLNKATKFVHVSILYVHARIFKFDSAYLSCAITLFFPNILNWSPKENMPCLLSLEANIRYKDCFASSEFSLSLSIEARLVYLAFYLASISSPSQRPRFQGRFRTFELFFVVSPYFISPPFVISINVSITCLALWQSLCIVSHLFIILLLRNLHQLFYSSITVVQFTFVFLRFRNALIKFSLRHLVIVICHRIFFFQSGNLLCDNNRYTLCPVFLFFLFTDVSTALGCLK